MSVSIVRDDLDDPLTKLFTVHDADLIWTNFSAIGFTFLNIDSLSFFCYRLALMMCWMTSIF